MCARVRPHMHARMCVLGCLASNAPHSRSSLAVDISDLQRDAKTLRTELSTGKGKVDPNAAS
eukprot:8834791-Pyramimonas_sp.AAC.1